MTVTMDHLQKSAKAMGAAFATQGLVANPPKALGFQAVG